MVDIVDASGRRFTPPDLAKCKPHVVPEGSVDFSMAEYVLHLSGEPVQWFLAMERKKSQELLSDEKCERDYNAEYEAYIKSLESEEVEPETVEGDFVETFKRFGDWTLVGSGEITSETCGNFLGLYGCKHVEKHDFTDLKGHNYKGHIHVKKIFDHCDKSSCPVCYKRGWAVREADRIDKIIKRFARGYVDSDGVRHSALGMPEHIIASINPEDYGLSYESMKNKTRKALFLRGVVGGVMIFHAFRYRRFDVVKNGIRNMRGWFYAPHFHCIGFFATSYHAKCRLCPKMHAFTYLTGSGKVVRQIGDERVCTGCDGYEAQFRLFSWGNKDIRTGEASGFWLNAKGRRVKADGFLVKVAGERRSIFSTAWYQLNHASVKVSEVNFSPISWFGACSNRKMKFKADSKRAQCCICHGEMVPLRYLGRKLFERFDWAGANDFIMPLYEEVNGVLIDVWEVDKDELERIERLRRAGLARKGLAV